MTDYARGLEKLGFGYMLDGVWYWTDSPEDTKGGWYGEPMDLRLSKHAAFAWRVLEAYLKNKIDRPMLFVSWEPKMTAAEELYYAVEALGRAD